MGFGAFSHFWSTDKGWDYCGGDGDWKMSRPIITLNGQGTSSHKNGSLLNIFGGLFLTKPQAGQIDVTLTATSGSKRPSFERSAEVSEIGGIGFLTPIRSQPLEIKFGGRPDNNEWAVEIVCKGLDFPHHQKIPGVSGWVGVSLMVQKP